MDESKNLPATADSTLDQVQLELEKARLAAKAQRRTAIGSLLDKATEVLSDVLDTTDDDHERARLEAASLAVNLYIQQENGERQDKALEIQQKRLELEDAKLRMPGGPLFNQTIVNVNASQQDPQIQEIERQALLARKQAQDALLSSYIQKKGPKDDDEGDS